MSLFELANDNELRRGNNKKEMNETKRYDDDGKEKKYRRNRQNDKNRLKNMRRCTDELFD